ncbi:hypothetical protein FF38_14098, partial [Lucilia cuprina]
KLPFEAVSISYNPESSNLLVLGCQFFALVKETGHILWMYKLPSPLAPENPCFWSQDGTHFCLIFESGSYTIYSTLNGRQIFGFQAVASDVSYMAFNEANNEFGILGHFDGSITINFQNKVQFRCNPFPEPQRCLLVAAHDNKYLAVGERHLACLNFTFEQNMDLGFKGIFNNRNLKLKKSNVDMVNSTSQLMEIYKRLARNIEVLNSEHTNFCNAMSKFCNSFKGENLEQDITNAVFWGKTTEELKQWMQHEHEQGFNRWYSNYTLHLSKTLAVLKQICNHDALEILNLELIIDQQPLMQFHRDCYTAICEFNTFSRDLSKQVCFLQKLFTDEIDRTIQLASEMHGEIIAEQRRPPPQRNQQSEKDLYKILGVSEKADKKQIRKAYRELSKKYHPDKYKGKDLTEDQIMAKMQDINEAYETLSNDENRQDYDEQRSGGG